MSPSEYGGQLRRSVIEGVVCLQTTTVVCAEDGKLELVHAVETAGSVDVDAHTKRTLSHRTPEKGVVWSLRVVHQNGETEMLSNDLDGRHQAYFLALELRLRGHIYKLAVDGAVDHQHTAVLRDVLVGLFHMEMDPLFNFFEVGDVPADIPGLGVRPGALV